MSIDANGGLPPGWAWTTLGDCLAWGSGGTPSRGHAEYFGGPIPWVVIGDLNDCPVRSTSQTITTAGLANSSAKLVPEGSVLLAMYGSIGKLGIVTTPMATNQAIAFTNSDHIASTYLFYYLMRVRNELIQEGKGGTQSNISQTVIKQFPFIVAPLPEQHRIVAAIEDYFSRLDEAVALLERVQRNLKRYRASVLKAAVEGRLVPTEAELARAEGRTYEPASVLLARILEERRRRWEQSGRKGKYQEPAAPDTTHLPELPEGWCWATVNQLSLLVTDGDHNPPKRVVEGIPHLTAKNVKGGRIVFDGCSFVSPEGFAQTRQRYEPLEGDLIVTCVGTVGETAVVPKWCVFSADRNLAAVRVVPDGLAPALLRAFLDSPDIKKVVRATSGSTAQPHLYLGDLKAILIPLPPQAEQERMALEVNHRMDEALVLLQATCKISSRAVRLRQSILKWAFEGRLADQDPADEPASVLLERIRAERAANGAAPKAARRGRPRRQGAPA